jgi:hypothetical protein
MSYSRDRIPDPNCVHGDGQTHMARPDFPTTMDTSNMEREYFKQ